MSLNLEQQAKLAFDSAKSSELQAKKTQELAQILKQQGRNVASVNLLTRAINGEQFKQLHKRRVSRERSFAQYEVDVVCYVNSYGCY